MASITVEQYAAGVVGLSLVRHWYRDATTNDARIDDLRRILDHSDEFPWNLALDPQERSLVDGYAEWARSYDGPNPLIAAEEVVAHAVLRRLAPDPTRALDAACGTGRHAAFLHSLGCEVVGVDQSEAMLAVARSKLPTARFEVGSLERLPFEDDEFDVAVVALALCHLEDPTKALTELARVVRPAGTVVVTDPHPSSGIIGGQAFYGGIADGRPMRWVRNHYHSTSTWLRAFRLAGLTVENCVEEPFSDEQITSFAISTVLPDATRAALIGLPSLWLWELRIDR